MIVSCKTCDGAGWLWSGFPFKRTCPTCGGDGRIRPTGKNMLRPVSPPRPRIRKK